MGRWQFNEPRHQPVAGRRAAGFRDACLALLLAGAGCGAPTPSTAAELAGETGTGAALAAEPPDHLVTVTFPSLRRDWLVLKQLPGIAEPLRALPEGVDALSLIVQAQLGPALGSSLLLDRPLAVTVYDRADEVQVVMAGALRKQTLARIRPHFALRRVVDGVLALDQPRQEGALFDDGGACQIHALSGAHYLACAVGERVDSARMRHVVLAAARAKSSDAVVRSAISERTWRRAVKESLDEDWPVFDELDRVLRDEFERFAFDIDGFDVELGGRGEQLGITLAFPFRSTRSLLSSVVLAERTRVDRVPPVFWRLPRDSLVAFRLAGMERGHRRADALAFWRRVLASESQPGNHTFGEADVQLVASTFFTGGPLIVAFGADPPAALEALRKRGQKPDAGVRQALSGWWMLGVDDPFANWVANMRGLIGRGAWASGGSGPDLSQPAPKSLPGPPELRSQVFLGELPAPTAEGLPAETVHVVSMTIPNSAYAPAGAGAPQPPPSSTHWLLFPLSGTSFACGSPVVERCTRRIRDMVDSKHMLAERPALQPLRSASGHLSGFVTAAGLTSLVHGADDAAAADRAMAALSLLEALPTRGMTPLMLFGDRPGARSVRVELRISYAELASYLGALAH